MNRNYDINDIPWNTIGKYKRFQFRREYYKVINPFFYSKVERRVVYSMIYIHNLILTYNDNLILLLRFRIDIWIVYNL